MLSLSNPKPTNRIKGRWAPGQSGNPGGRNGREARYDAAALAREYTPEAIKALVVALRYPRERVPAAIALLDRGYGKPQVSIASEVNVNVLHLIAAELVSNALPHETVKAIVDTASDDTPSE